jgi:uncharacterized protein (TIGR02246 family)
MSRSRLFAVCLVLLGCTVGGTALADDANLIRQSSEAFSKAFDKGDAKAVAALWTEDGQLVDEAGKAFNGRPAIEAVYAKFFQEHPGAKIKVAIDSVRMLNDDTAIEEGRAALDPLPVGAAESAKYTAVHIKQDGKWQMASVYESSAAAPSAAGKLDSLDWLVGTWSAEERGVTTHVDCRWLPNKTFLLRKYTVTAADGTKSSGVQLIGLEPRTGQIISSGFNSDGSRTMGNWMPQAKGWAIDAIGQTANGADTHAINLLTKLDDNAYSWQSLGRSAAGQALPDTGEIILKRTVSSTAPKTK